MFARNLALIVLSPFALLAALPAAAQPLPCKPCAGVRVADPAAAAARLADAALPKESILFVAWEAALTPAGTGSGSAAAALAAVGATPWIALPFTTPSPLLAHAAALEIELEEASRIAREAGGSAYFQILWRPGPAVPESGAPLSDPATEYAFLLKRAAVAVSGAAPGARVVSRPLAADPVALAALYAEEVAAYLDAVALAPAGEAETAAALAALTELDPGRPTVVDALALPDPPVRALAEAARGATAGASAVLFEVSGAIGAETLAPFVTLAKEFAGDLAADPGSAPTGTDGAWAFVRGTDLGLRVIAVTPAPGGTPADEVSLAFPDPTLRSPARVDPMSGEALPLAAGRRTGAGFELRVADPGPVAILRLERPGAAELEAAAGVGGVEERLDVASERDIPVEEILRRLQAFEDAQARRIDHYAATNTTHLRFGASAGQTFEATLQGDFFFRAGGGGDDWAWQSFYVNGVRWRGENIPEIPLVQPEKAAAMPLAITFDKTYRYRLRGTETIDGRDCWVIEFAPAAGTPAEDEKLYRGTVWVDRQVFARVRTRGVQLGLTGEVLSNEETLTYTPIDVAGAPAAWSPESFVLPLRIVAQQLLSVVNATTLVERETRLTAVTINGPDFAERYQRVLDSEATMVRDTPEGLRYLVKDDASGGRVVKEGFDRDKLFLAGGVFYDDALDYPLPLAGVNYFSFDVKGTGNQLNVFFAGALLTVNAAQPRLFGSKFDFGGDLFAVAIPFSDQLYRDDVEVKDEEVERRPASASLKIGRPLGQFVKLGLEYRVNWFDYSTTDETAEAFVLPQDHFTHNVGLNLRATRFGYSLTGEYTLARRSTWEFWGLPGNAEFDPAQKDYSQWGLSLAKTWHLPRFQRVGAEVGYFSGSDLDRFSKYEFGFFGDTRIQGYQSDRVRAESLYASHFSYGFGIGEAFRLDALADLAWATDETSGLEDDLLAGVGLSGSFIGPWQTLINLDVGTPVAGPDDGWVAYIVFLKLFK